MTQIELTIADRAIIASLLPQRGGKIKMLVAKSVADLIEFSLSEIQQFEMKDSGDGLITWNPAKSQAFQFDFYQDQIDLIKECLADADKREAITREMLPLITKLETVKN
ncbi:hypothetical protein BWI93_03070 [Siphonobacter sp. BAB-5385]|uniref:hypothetical protein n=1 Tax=Siphonobacter sp. BAB-5385 TaxID=1864822 RepID=UPI000B9E17EC|nr:hypothetical protein [Siphonobacter sp. BAB-5385]OZI09578.1 hypothetical protein BWI93_03070 [Siphonobacter sp. BAB-5385]